MQGADEQTVAAGNPVTVTPLPLHLVAPSTHTQVRSPSTQAAPPAVDIGDLIAYEYFDDTAARWRCELATVLDKPEPEKLLVERLVQKSRKSVRGVVATTAEGQAILEQLSDLQEELTQRVGDAQQRSREVREKRRAVQREKRELDDALEIAREHLGDVRTAVEKIDIRHWRELVSYRTPPEIVVRVMAAVMLVLGERRRTWAEIMTVLHRPGMTQLLATFDSSTLTRAQREEVLTRYINTPKFTYEEAIKGSSALSELYRWVVAHVLMINVSEQSTQMSRLHARRSSDLDEMEQLLQEDSKNIAAVNSKIEALWQRFREAEAAGPSSFSDSASLTPRESNSARQRRSLARPPETARAGETLQMMSRTWHYASAPERRLISIYNVLCRLGPAPPRGETITLLQQQCKELLAAAQVKDRRSNSVLQPAKKFPRNGDATNDETPQKPPAEALLTPRKQVAEAIAKLERQLQKSTEDKAAIERELQQNKVRNQKEETPSKNHSNENDKKKKTPQKRINATKETQRNSQLKDTSITTQEPSPSKSHKEKAAPVRESNERCDALAALERQLKERDDALAELERRLEESGGDKAALEREPKERADALAALERQLKERDDALAELERRLEESGGDRAALERESKVSART
ncbi:dynein heavy chain, cytosolic, partial [Trypanosoma conorhini]